MQDDILQENPQGGGTSSITVRILLADDHTIVRRGLKRIIESCDGMRVIAEAEDGGEAVEKAEAHAPDVILMDVSMPQMDGIEATREIKARFPQVAVIGLSAHAADSPQFRQMLAAGADDCLTKDCSIDQLCAAILRACSSHPE